VPAPTTGPRLGVVIVTYHSAGALRRTLPALTAELEPGDELVVVDNASGDDTLAVVPELAPQAEVVANAANVGFAAAANQGVERTRAELVLLLNPDAVPAPGFGRAIRRPLEEGRGWTAWMGLVTAEEGHVVNTSGGVVHFTGIAWAGEAGLPLGEAALAPHEVGFASGACLAVERAAWRRAGGFRDHFFMYCEDVDLSLRLRLAGERVGVEPAARVDHDYSFVKGSDKWRLLERNRWAVVLAVYPRRLLVLLAPALVATELALLPAAAAGGWLGEKLRASADTLAGLPRLRRERRAVQATRRVPSTELARWLTPELSSAYLGRAGRSAWLRAALGGYWGLVGAALRALERRS
jgi:GT2 family glycosyltransferase